MSGRVAWSLFGLSLLAAGTALGLWSVTRSLDVSAVLEGADPGAIVAFLVYAAVGSLIVSRRFGNRVGWIFVAMGLVFELGLLAQEYAVYALRWSPGSLPGGAWAGLLADCLPAAAFGLGTLLLLVFPTGHLLSRRWVVVGWLAASSVLVVLLQIAFEPGTLDSVERVAKPVEVDFPLVTSGGWAWPGLLLGGLLAIVSVIIRYRRGDAVERQQLRWFIASVPIFVGAIFWVPGSDALAAVVALGFAAPPIAAGLAIFRYRLYDLDLVLKRTLVYGVLSASLAGIYFGIVVALQQVFSSFAGGSDLAIAISTLAVAALFRPVRARIQRLVDRRFNRQRYDAQQTLEAFSARLRDEIDLDALAAEIGAIVRTTMQPAHVTLSLRRPEGPP
jgi:hypothetical protein